MALNFIKSQFIEVIEWSDTTKETLAYKFPIQQKEIKNGSPIDGFSNSNCSFYQ